MIESVLSKALMEGERQSGGVGGEKEVSQLRPETIFSDKYYHSLLINLDSLPTQMLLLITCGKAGLLKTTVHNVSSAVHCQYCSY